MKITDIDLSSFRYDPSNPKSIQKLCKDYPGSFDEMLFEDPELMKYHEEILRYIILVYDLNSPLLKTEKTHNERKVKAMLMAGFDANDLGKFQHNIEEALLYGKDKGIAKMIVSYVYLFNSIDYSELVGMMQLNSHILRDIMNNKTNNQTHVNLKNTSARIKELTADIFGGKETKEIEQQLYEQLNMSRMSFRPESIAKQHREGAVDLKDIYGINKKKSKNQRIKKYGGA